MKLTANYKCTFTILMMLFPLLSFGQYKDTQLGHDGFMGSVKSAKITSHEVEMKEDKVTKGNSSSYQIRSYNNMGILESNNDYIADGTAIKTQENTLNDDGKLIERLDQMGEMVIKRETYSFNKSGDLVESITYTGDGSINKKVINVYNDKNQLFESSQYSSSFDELLLTERKQFEYDKDGNNIKISYFGPEGENWGSEEREFDSNGNEIEWINLTETGEIKIRQTFLYNEENVLTSRKSFDRDGNLTNEANLGPLGQPLSLIYYDADGNVTRKSGNRYDKFGNSSAELRYGADGSESVYAEYEYKYDDKNNWIEQIAYRDGQAAYIVVREITYY